MFSEVDVLIIGAGTAGLSARREVAKVTDSYVVVDDGPLGTTCARVGCMPSKVLIEVANLYERRKVMPELGIDGGEHLSLSPPGVMKHVRKLRDRFVRAVLKDMESWSDHLIRERATILCPNLVRVGQKEIRAKKVVVAAGSTPVVPRGWREEFGKFFMDTDSFFEELDLPGSLAVIGLGVIGAELGQAMARLGVAVTGIGDPDSIGGVSEPQMQAYVASHFAKELQILPGRAEKMDIAAGKLRICTDRKAEVKVDRALLAMGRIPQLSGLGLSNLPLSLNEQGVPEIDSGTWQVKGTNWLWVAGDASRSRMILHEAADQGRIAGYNAVHSSQQCFKKRTPLAITFTSPNIAVAGQRFCELEPDSFVTGFASFEGQGRAIVKIAEKGMIKIFADKNSARILGSEIFAPEGEHLAHLLAWCMELGLDVFRVLSMPFYHPVLEEGLRTALRDAARQVTRDKPLLEVLRCQDPPAGS